MNISELAQIAMLGTERQSISPPLATTALGELGSKLDVNQRERTLLSLAALSSLHDRIGSLPAQDKTSLPSPCPTEQLERVSERVGLLLLRLLGGEHAELLPEWLQLAAQAGQISPPEALPALLNNGATKADLRETILPVLGERGRWLAAQNPEWGWVSSAANEDENLWHTGESAARLAFLQRLRKKNPAHARELLVASWKTESPEDRAALINALGIELGAEDEAFLEVVLDDKRKEVRRTAAALLARLTDSGLVKRMVRRAAPLLHFIPGAAGSLLKLKKAKPASIEVTLPAECDKAMERDGIEVKPLLGFGEKAGWLIQLLEVVPLGHWTRSWGVGPPEILAAALEIQQLNHPLKNLRVAPVEISTGVPQAEWSKELFEGWTRAAVRQQNVIWAELLFDFAIAGKRLEKIEGLLSTMSVERREAKLTALLAEPDAKTHDSLIIQCRHDWSIAFSCTVLARLRHLSGQESGDWSLRNQIKDFAPRLAPEVLGEAAAGWPTDAKGWEFWSKGADEFLAVAQFRADVRSAFKIEH